MKEHKKILVLGIGNDILSDDAVGLVAARKLRGELSNDVEVEEAYGLGLELLETLEGYEYALLLDAVMTGQREPGTIMEFTQNDFAPEISSSPHYVGLPEVFKMAEKLHIPFPKEIRILALEVEDPYHIHEGLTVAVEEAIPALIKKAKEIIISWAN